MMEMLDACTKGLGLQAEIEVRVVGCDQPLPRSLWWHVTV
jgi:hypothetical protein